MSAIEGPPPVPLQELLKGLGELRAENRRLWDTVRDLGGLLVEAWEERDRALEEERP